MEYDQTIQQHRIYNILLLGMLGVGKSALTVKYITRRFINEYHPYLEGTYSKLDMFEGEEILVRIHDSGSPDDTSEKVIQQYSQKLDWADIIMVVYSVNNRHSFEYARDLLYQLSKVNLNLKTYLVCNKLDMERHRQITKEESEQTAFDYDVALLESSSCSDYDVVQSVFHDAIRDVRKTRICKSRQKFKSRPIPLLSMKGAKISAEEFAMPHRGSYDDHPNFQNDFGTSLPSYSGNRIGSESSPILNNVTDAMLFRNYNNNSPHITPHYKSCSGIHKKALSLSDEDLELRALDIIDSAPTPNNTPAYQHALVTSAKSTSLLKEKFAANGAKGRRHTGFSLFNSKFKIFS